MCVNCIRLWCTIRDAMHRMLETILARKAERLEEAKRARPRLELDAALARGRRRAATTFAEALARPGRLNVVAEIKRASPSKGIIRDDLDPTEVAAAYAPHAAAISVLTEEDHFLGSLDALRRVGERVDLPLLRKDFLWDEYQLAEAAEAGADAVLLIAAALERARLADLLAAASALGLDALVEVHTPHELESVLHFDHSLIGVNNRNLRTFEVDVATSFAIAREAPAGTLLVSESGIASRETIDALSEAGYRAFLIGEHFMRSSDPARALAALVG
jgi:indole-3-glycerol phosphate synthase